MRVRRGAGAADDETGRALLRDYLLGWGRLDARGEGLVAAFPEPFDRYLLAGDVGLVCLRAMEPRAGEVKRLYVAPAHRRRGIARALVEAAVAEARALGYTTLRLDTPAGNAAAIALYESLGWQPIPPWDHGEEMVAFELAV